MQDADGPPEQVDQWRLVIDDPERVVWRRAWLAGSANVRGVDTERRYQEIEISKNDLTGEFEVVFTDNTPIDTPGVASFGTDTESEVGSSASRQGAIKLAVEEMAIKRRDIAGGDVDEITDREWVNQRRPEPDFTGKALTDFSESDSPDTPERSLRERLVDETGGKAPIRNDENWPDMPDRIGDWRFGATPDALDDFYAGASVLFLYGTSVTATNQPPRIVHVGRFTYRDYTFGAFVEQPKLSGLGSSDPAVTADTQADIADRLVRYLNKNPPSEVDHPRWDGALYDVGAVADQWELDYVNLSKRKTNVKWLYQPDATNPDDCGPWAIKYEGNLNTNDYTFTFITGPDVDDRVNEQSTGYDPETLDVVLPPRPSLVAVSGRAAQIAAKIADNPCDPWNLDDVPHPDPNIDTLDAREVESLLEQMGSEITSEGISSDPDLGFILSKIDEQLRTVARLDKQSMGRFKSASIRNSLRSARVTITRRFDVGRDTTVGNAIERVKESIVSGDDHPANHTDGALDALREFAAEREFEDVASGGFDSFG